MSPHIEINGNRVGQIQWNDIPPTYEDVNFYASAIETSSVAMGDADFRNIVYETC